MWVPWCRSSIFQKAPLVVSHQASDDGHLAPIIRVHRHPIHSAEVLRDLWGAQESPFSTTLGRRFSPLLLPSYYDQSPFPRSRHFHVGREGTSIRTPAKGWPTESLPGGKRMRIDEFPLNRLRLIRTTRFRAVQAIRERKRFLFHHSYLWSDCRRRTLRQPFPVS